MLIIDLNRLAADTIFTLEPVTDEATLAVMGYRLTVTRDGQTAAIESLALRLLLPLRDGQDETVNVRVVSNVSGEESVVAATRSSLQASSVTWYEVPATSAGLYILIP